MILKFSLISWGSLSGCLTMSERNQYRGVQGSRGIAEIMSGTIFVISLSTVNGSGPTLGTEESHVAVGKQSASHS